MNGEAPTAAVTPTVSVVVPVRDRTTRLQRAVASILAQTLADFELIVVDDGSTEPVRAALEQNPDKRVRYIRQEPKGANEARNRGAMAARGTYLTFMDSDDEVVPTWLEEVVPPLKSGADLVCCGFRSIRPDGTEVDQLPRLQPLFGVRAMFSHAGTFLLPTEYFRRVGGYAPGLLGGHHNELAMRLMLLALKESWRIVNVDRPLVKYYQGSPDGIRTDDAAVLAGSEYLLTHHHELLARAPRRLAHSYAMAGVRASRLGRQGRALKHFWGAVRADPLRFKHWVRLLLASIPGVGSRLWRRHRARANTTGTHYRRDRGDVSGASEGSAPTVTSESRN